jgi:hypothetical protein
MGSQSIRHALLLAMAASAACSTDNSVAPATQSNGSSSPGGSSPASAPPRIVSLDVTPGTGVAVDLGSTFTFRVFAVRSDSGRVPVQEPSFTSLAPGVLAVNGVTGIASAVGAGNAAVAVRGSGVEAIVVVTVLEPQSLGASAALTVNSFSLIQYGPSTYAPQVNVSASPSTSVTVLNLQFWVSGLPNIPPIGCGGKILAGASSDLNGEVYGDWTFSFGGSAPAASNDPVVVVTFIDGTGATGSVTAHGKIAAGGFPTSYTGGQNGGPCFHGRVP